MAAARPFEAPRDVLRIVLGYLLNRTLLLSFLREEFNEYFGALNEAQVVAILVVIFTVPLLVWKAQLVRPTTNQA